MRSEERAFTKDLIRSRATSSRFCGWKSWASIELEMSNATTMLIPSDVDVTACAPARGRARATTPLTSARFRSSARKRAIPRPALGPRSEEHTSELQSRQYLVCRLLLEKKKKKKKKKKKNKRKKIKKERTKKKQKK